MLRPVAEQYNLLERENQLSGLDAAKIQARRRAPVALKRLKVKRPPNTYLLQISYRSADPQLAADVANAVANSYLTHTYTIRIRSSASLSSFMEKQLDELKAKMERSSDALAQFEKELNVINPEEKTSILSARLLQLNTEYTNAEADRVRKEAAYNSMKSGSLEAAQVSTQGEALNALTQRLNEAQAAFRGSEDHLRRQPSRVPQGGIATGGGAESSLTTARVNIAGRIEVDYRQALNREQMLRSAVAQTKAESDSLNSRSFEYQQLKREADADKTLYDELVRKIREADINAGFQNNNIRIADMARPANKAVFPNMPLNLMLAFLFSSLLAVGAAVLADTMDTTMRDPEQASRYPGYGRHWNPASRAQSPATGDWPGRRRRKHRTTALTKAYAAQ